MNCNNLESEIKIKIETESLKKYDNNNPKFKIAINLDSLKNELLKIDDREKIHTTPHIVVFSKKYNQWMSPFRKLDSLNDNHKWGLFYSLQEFGKYSLSNENRKNQIGYQIFGKKKDVKNEININLNIHTLYTREEVLLYYFEHIKGILKTLNIEMPIDLEMHIKKGKVYYLENDQHYLMLTNYKKKEKDYSAFGDSRSIINFEEHKFIIKSK